MSANTPFLVSKESQVALAAFANQCYLMLGQNWNLRTQMTSIDLAYQRELDYTDEQWKAQAANRMGDPTKFQNVVIPVIMPAVENAVTYQSSVFLTGNPIFDWVAPPGQESAARQFSAITEENSIRGGWTQQLMMVFRDAFKYNLAFCETTFGRQVSNTVETDVGFTYGKQGKPKEVIWQGNVLKRWDPYNTFWDTRYPPSRVYKDGEFIGMTELMSRIHLKKFIAELPDKFVANLKDAFESGIGTGGGNAGGLQSYYVPRINRNAILSVDTMRTMDWGAWAGLLPRPNNEFQYRNLYEVTTLYARIIPQDFLLRVPGANTPQIWKLIVVNHQHIIYIERQTNAHNFLPVLIAQPYEDGLGYQTKSLADNTRPFQEVGSALINSAMAARRRAISDRGIYNPLLISAAHINNDSPVAKIPMRPAGYNKEPSHAYMPIPFRDEQSGLAFQELSQILALSDKLTGSNPAKGGQFVKGNKTRSEYESVMANANGRDQCISIVLEGQFFTPMKEMLKINTLQYQQGITVFSPAQNAQVKIDPVELRKSAVTYKISDGLLPTEKIISGDDLGAALQTLATNQQLNSSYNLGPMFSYLMSTRNVDLSPFEKPPAQVTYEQAVAAWQQTVMQVAKAGTDKYPPQPTPQQFGYDPNAASAQTGNSTSNPPSRNSSSTGSSSPNPSLPNFNPSVPGA